MKEIKQEVITIKSEWEAIDGKRFDTKEECIAYEKKISPGAIFQANLHPLDVCGELYGIPNGDDDHLCYLCIPKTAKHIEIINTYIRSVVEGNYSNPRQIDNSFIDKSIIIWHNYDKDWCEVYDLWKHIDEIRENAKDLIENYTIHDYIKDTEKK